MGRKLRLGEGIGLELELMLVARDSLDVRPLADQLLFEACRAAGRAPSGDHDNGPIGWSNELVLHVLELKNSAPAADVAGAAALFQENVREINARLVAHAACLMPGGMHPWMDPRRETVLWPHEYSEVYGTYDRVFDCKRHGWANLQSVHLNLSFGDDQEFARLHAAARLVLPLVPALAASSPVMEGRVTGLCDQRLEVYRTNATQVPAMTGAVIPEPVFTREAYERAILAPLQAAVSELEPTGVLEGEWLNARGAIARFDRDALEIRLIDTQECPRADVAVAWAVARVVAELCDERWASTETQQAFAVAPLAELLAQAIRLGPRARVNAVSYARALGWRGSELPTLGELWRDLLESVVGPHPRTPAELAAPLQTILRHGTLSERIVKVLGASPSRARLHAVYGELCACLAEGRLFGGG